MSSIVWVPVPGYESSYEISNKGIVRLKSRDITNSDGEVITAVPPKEVEIRKTEYDPFPHVVLYDGKTYNKESIESLIAKAFISE